MSGLLAGSRLRPLVPCLAFFVHACTRPNAFSTVGGNGLNGAVVRSLSRSTGYDHTTVSWALVRQDVAALFDLPYAQPPERITVTGDVRALDQDARPDEDP